jgi:ankyrin repeat protein
MGYTPLHNAVTGGWVNNGRIDVVKFLLDNGANPLAEVEDNEGMTPRQWLLYIRNDKCYREDFDYLTYDEIEDEKKVDRIIADMLKQREKEILSLLLLRGNVLEKSREKMYDPRVWRMVLNYAQSRRKLSSPSFSEEKDD